MHRKPLFRLLSAAATVMALGLAPSAHAATEIQFWHAMEAALGERLNDIANDFNASQSDYKIVPYSKAATTRRLRPALPPIAAAMRRRSCRSTKSAPRR